MSDTPTTRESHDWLTSVCSCCGSAPSGKSCFTESQTIMRAFWSLKSLCFTFSLTSSMTWSISDSYVIISISALFALLLWILYTSFLKTSVRDTGPEPRPLPPPILQPPFFAQQALHLPILSYTFEYRFPLDSARSVGPLGSIHMQKSFVSVWCFSPAYSWSLHESFL